MASIASLSGWMQSGRQKTILGVLYLLTGWLSTMDKTPCLFIPIASAEEIKDAKSWINNSYQWDQRWQDVICQRVGEAIVAWAEVETELLMLYLKAIKAEDGHAAASAWDSLQSPRALIDMTNAAICAMSHTATDLVAWSKINLRLVEKLRRRNLVAHSRVFYDHSAAVENRKMFIGSPKTTTGPQVRVYPSELADMRKVFQELAEAIQAFRAAYFSNDLP